MKRPAYGQTIKPLFWKEGTYAIVICGRAMWPSFSYWIVPNTEQFA